MISEADWGCGIHLENDAIGGCAGGLEPKRCASVRRSQDAPGRFQVTVARNEPEGFAIFTRFVPHSADRGHRRRLPERPEAINRRFVRVPVSPKPSLNGKIFLKVSDRDSIPGIAADQISFERIGTSNDRSGRSSAHIDAASIGSRLCSNGVRADDVRLNYGPNGSGLLNADCGGGVSGDDVS